METEDSLTGEHIQLKSRWKTGLLLLSVVVGLWVISGFLVNVSISSDLCQRPIAELDCKILSSIGTEQS